MSQKKILITGAAGFIGFHLVRSLMELGEIVVGIDNINNYYDINLKYNRLKEVGIEKSEIQWHDEVISNIYPNFRFIRMNLEDYHELNALCMKEQFDCIVNLAAQAGVRYSLENPSAYIQSNLVGFGNIAEVAKNSKVQHLIYASSSSVYGLNKKIPFSIFDNVDSPISLYAATKKANELIAHVYSHLFRIPTTGLRFFTVYGPWGRPDMAYFDFTKKIVNDTEITVYNDGKMTRDFTYISDVIDGILKVIELGFNVDQSGLEVPWRILNLGNNKPVSLLSFIETLENSIGKKALKNFADIQKGDVVETWADISQTQSLIDFNPKVDISEGLTKFAKWYTNYFKNEK